MNAYKKDQNLKYKIMSIDEDVDDVDDEMPEEHEGRAKVEPIPGLIEYIKDVYKEDVTPEIKDYETKINKDTKEE